MAEKGQKAMGNHILKPLTFTVIMLSSIQTVEIFQKLTLFLILVETSNFYAGQAKMTKKGVLNQ